MPRIARPSRLYRSADTEVTGLDTNHGALPFIYTSILEGEDDPTFYEWDVDPLTRRPDIPQEDVEEIAESLSGNEIVVFQNPKFDVKVLDTIGVWKYADVWKFWKRVEDTLIAGHLLASNQPHDLTSMALIYLNINIKHFEEEIDAATKAARHIVKSKAFVEKYGKWRIAEKGLPEMPSAKGEEKLFKFDMWLPRTVARLAPDFLPEFGEWKLGDDPAGHPWWTVCSDYANADSSVTLPLFKRQLEIIQGEGLESIYRERIKVLPVAYRMEKDGITVSKERLGQRLGEFQEESERLGRICTNIADGYGYELELPKGGKNNSLTNFVFDVLKLPVVKKTESGAPSLDKHAIAEYLATLPTNSKPLTFVRSLQGKRSLDTASGFMEAYQRFWVPLGIFNEKGEQLWYRIFPSLNPTGTDTLRWSSNNPNSQNISKLEEYNVRVCFGPAPGREWWSCDASNIELRIPAYEAGEDAMIELFERPNDPPYFGSNHLLFFDILHPEKWDRTDSKGLLAAKKKYASTWYQWTKNGDFAVQYGAVAESGTADRAYHVPGAQARIESHLTKIKALSNRMIAAANKCGYVETIPDKNVCPERGYPLLCTRSQWGKILETVPLSYHVQGTAMWWMMKAMIRCQELLDELNLKAKKPNHYRIALQVHDELVFDFPRGESHETNKPIITEIRRLMTLGGDDISIPTPVGGEYHAETWAKGLSV